MATFAKHLPFFFLIMSSTCYQIQARDSKFFYKYRHLSTTNHVTIPSTNPKVVPLSSPSPSPSPIRSRISGVPASAPIGPDTGSTPAPAPITLGADYSPAPDWADSGSTPAPAPITFGADYSPAPAPAAFGADYSPAPAPSENDIPYYGLYGKENGKEEEDFATENPEELNNRESYTYSNGYSNSLSNNNGFWTSNHNGYHSTNNGYDFDGGYKSEPQGMSDTRLLDNGKYYYDVEPENYNPSGYENNEEGYGYGNNKSKYEFDSMEEYEKQEGYADVRQDQFIP